MNKSVSVIVPIYNREKYIRECVESIINQTYKDLEIILVNDGSTDKSLEIINEYAKNDLRIRIINKDNGGLSSARNTGIEAATSEYIMYVDGDDFINERTVEDLINKAKKEDLDVVIYDFLIFKNNTYKTWKDINIENNKCITGKEYLMRLLTDKGISSVCNKLWRRSLYIDNNIRHPINISYGEDGSTLPRLIVNAERVGKLSKSYYNYRINSSSMMMNDNIKYYQYVEAYNIAFEYIKDKGIKLDEGIKFTYKYDYAYKILETKNMLNKKNKSEQLVLLYNQFCKDVKCNDIVKCGQSSLGYLKKKLLVRAYKKSRILGDLIKIIMMPINKYYINKEN